MEMKQQAIQEYIAFKIDGKTEIQLISDAQDQLSMEIPPSWIEKLAFLSHEEMSCAYSVLEAELFKLGLLPDSNELRLGVRRELEIETGSLAVLGEEQKSSEKFSRIKQLLKLLPTYEFNDLTIPIVEYPYPPSGIVNYSNLAKYLMRELDRLVPCEYKS